MILLSALILLCNLFNAALISKINVTLNKKNRLKLLSLFFLFTSSNFSYATNPPQGFVYLKNIDPTIVQDIRYYGNHNFVGRRIKGYQSPECILTLPAANALAKVQRELKQSSLSLKVYDCYRPQMAVDDFVAWSKIPNQNQMQKEFYPRIKKTDLFPLGYVFEKSGHTRGSTVDLTIVPIPTLVQAKFSPQQKLVACFAPHQKRFYDNSIDMGTGYDCMDVLAHALNKNIEKTTLQNRLLLRKIMQKYGFEPYEKEWWHFTLKNEPYPYTYFNFPIQR